MKSLLASLLLTTSCLLAGGPDDLYHQAAQALAAGKAAEAARDLEALHREGPVSPESYLLLGNARAAEGQPAEAMAAYRRALLLDPGLAEARQNLTYLARQQGVAEAPPPGLFTAFLARLPLSWLVLATALSGWLGVTGLAVRRFRPWLPAPAASPWVLPVSVILLGTTAVTGTTLLLRRHLVAPVTDLRVVMAEDKLLPLPARRAGDSPVVEKIKAGTLARLLEDQEAWAYVEVPTGNGQTTLRGWVRGQSLRPLCDFDPRLLNR